MMAMNDNPEPRSPAVRRRAGARFPAPEGPYETEDQRTAAGSSNRESGQFLDFIEQMEEASARLLALKSGYREMRIVIHLIRSHLSGQLVTSSSLAAASGMSYGTAMRAIDDMQVRGLIIKRPRTPTGRSFSLHPAAALLAQWQAYARRAKSLVAASLRQEQPGGRAARPRSAAADPAAGIVPLPPVLDSKLALSRQLRMLMHADPTFMAMHVLKRHFEMAFGTAISSRALSIDRLHAEIVVNSRLPVSQYDLIACDLPWFGEMAASGRLLALDRLIEAAKFDTADFHPDALASTRHRGRQYGVPVITTAEILVYRTDLLAAAGIAPPLTAAATLDAASRLHDPSAGISGIAWNGGRGTPVGHTFLMILAAFGQPVVDLRPTADGFDAENASGEQLRPLFLTETARQTADYMCELVEYSPPNILNMAWYDRAAAYAQGKAAIAYSHTMLAPLFELDRTSPAYRRTGYLPHPVGPKGRPIAPLGGYALTIPANIAPERIEPVWIALRALTSANTIKLYLANGSLASPRFSLSRDPEIRALSPMVAAVDDMARLGYMRMWPRPPIPENAPIVAIIGEEIHDMLSGAQPVAHALAAAQNRVDALMRARGHY
jgi:multiple sugar transport system substrate-binding protein